MTDDTTETAAAAPVEPTLDEVLDPDQLICDAEEEEAEAEALKDALEYQYRQGDDVEPEQVERARKLHGFAKMAVERATNRAAKLKAQRYAAAAEQLAAEAETYGAGIGARLAKALEGIGRAEDAFLKIAAEHVAVAVAVEWTRRAAALGVPEATGRPKPPAVDGRLARVGVGSPFMLQVGQRRIELIDGLARLQKFRTSNERAGLIAGIAKIDAEQALPDEELVYYRNRETGAYFHFDADKVPTTLPAEFEPVSREEALGL